MGSIKKYKLVTAEGRIIGTYDSKQGAVLAWESLNGIWEDENDIEHYIYIEEV